MRHRSMVLLFLVFVALPSLSAAASAPDFTLRKVGDGKDQRCASDGTRLCPAEAVPFCAHPSPRPLPGRPRRFTLEGHSFAAAANITGRVARILEERHSTKKS